MNTARQVLQLKGFEIYSINPDATVLEALQTMADKNVGVLLVMQADRLVGILSERDYARKVVLRGRASKDTKVSEIMTSEIFTVQPENTLETCMEVLNAHNIRHLPVMEGGNVLGVISTGDVVRAILHRQGETIRNLEDMMLDQE